jgi:hypothetical protein
MAIYDGSPGGTADYRTDYQSQPQPEYHTADARAAAPVENTIDPGSGYRTAAPATAYPPADSPRSRLPSADYRPPDYPSTGDPLAGNRAATSPVRNYGYPRSYDPASSTPATNYPSGNYPANNYPANNYPESTYPSGNYPTSNPSAAASPAPGYRAGAYPRYSEPPVAKFRGGIERATGSSLYDSNRPSVH